MQKEKVAVLGRPRRLTVILRNDAPMIFCGDSPSYRSVHVELTDEQWVKIKPKDENESISTCFIEPRMEE